MSITALDADLPRDLEKAVNDFFSRGGIRLVDSSFDHTLNNAPGASKPNFHYSVSMTLQPEHDSEGIIMAKIFESVGSSEKLAEQANSYLGSTYESLAFKHSCVDVSRPGAKNRENHYAGILFYREVPKAD